MLIYSENFFKLHSKIDKSVVVVVINVLLDNVNHYDKYSMGQCHAHKKKKQS